MRQRIFQELLLVLELWIMMVMKVKMISTSVVVASIRPPVLEHCNSIIQLITFVEKYDNYVSHGRTLHNTHVRPYALEHPSNEAREKDCRLRFHLLDCSPLRSSSPCSLREPPTTTGEAVADFDGTMKPAAQLLD
jgi:uncharacterized short protein YbdD (DUF466 family)